jgi:hypothetical protein
MLFRCSFRGRYPATGVQAAKIYIYVRYIKTHILYFVWYSQNYRVLLNTPVNASLNSKHHLFAVNGSLLTLSKRASFIDVGSNKPRTRLNHTIYFKPLTAPVKDHLGLKRSEEILTLVTPQKIVLSLTNSVVKYCLRSQNLEKWPREFAATCF